MSVARNLWRVADAPHIVPADSVERQTVERLINACPAGLFSLTPEGDCALIIAAARSVAPAVAVRRINTTTVALSAFRIRHHLQLWINNKDNLCPSYLLRQNPVIAAVKDNASLQLAIIDSECQFISVLCGNICHQ